MTLLHAQLGRRCTGWACWTCGICCVCWSWCMLLVLRLAGVEGRRQRGRHELVHLVRLLVGAHRRLEVLLLELEWFAAVPAA